MALNEVITPHARRIQYEPLDMRFIHVWPKQKKLAKMYFSILADELEKDSGDNVIGLVGYATILPIMTGMSSNTIGRH